MHTGSILSSLQIGGFPSLDSSGNIKMIRNAQSLRHIPIYKMFAVFLLFVRFTVWYEIIFRHLNDYSLANMQDIEKFLLIIV